MSSSTYYSAVIVSWRSLLDWFISFKVIKMMQQRGMPMQQGRYPNTPQHGTPQQAAGKLIISFGIEFHIQRCDSVRCLVRWCMLEHQWTCSNSNRLIYSLFIFIYERMYHRRLLLLVNSKWLERRRDTRTNLSLLRLVSISIVNQRFLNDLYHGPW